MYACMKLQFSDDYTFRWWFASKWGHQSAKTLQVPLAKVRETPWKTAAQHMVFWLQIFVWVQQTVQIGILLPLKSATKKMLQENITIA